MKIHQLPIGARFSYEGVEYVKTGPLVGSGPGGQRLIPKHAVLKAVGETAAAVADPAVSLDPACVGAAFERFYQCCETLVPAEHHTALQAARAEFFRTVAP